MLGVGIHRISRNFLEGIYLGCWSELVEIFGAGIYMGA